MILGSTIYMILGTDGVTADGTVPIVGVTAGDGLGDGTPGIGVLVGTVDGMATIPDGTEDGTDGDTVPTEAGMPTTDAVQADAAETEVFGPAADAVVAAASVVAALAADARDSKDIIH